ncbi:Flp pilus assembly complex ATPase component TadA [Candidatus Parcubacteria bacterium]|nr:Flp pilus assembly complex ATPase component TadA [Candidatus Parcubacteria bacterium]
MEVISIFINKILSEAVRKKSTSLRLSIGSFPMIRVNGELLAMENEEIISRETLTGIVNSIVSDEEWKSIEREKEVVLVRDFPGGLRFRINVFFQKNLPTISFYLIPHSIRQLNELNLPTSFTDFVSLKSGLIVVVGPFSSGKTSTIASFIDKINREQYKYIITIEDPIEQIFISQKSVINQRQVGIDSNSFSSALSYCLEEDVDLIYVSSIEQDFNSAMPIIMNLAAGNSLVILELNSNNSVNVLERILSASYKTMSKEAARYCLADVLQGILVQDLFPKVGGEMVMAYELLINNSAIKSLIREGKLNQIKNVIESSGNDGMRSMKKSIDTLIKNGEI